MQFSDEEILKVRKNYTDLPEDEKDLFREFLRSPFSDVVGKVLELPSDLMEMGRRETKEPKRKTGVGSGKPTKGLMGQFV